ncbi:hypothetical protein [Iningainema tapete]|uniref:VWFA domain-containing protein n=1 Tax=Iningainema tapete BLCC-T55 TaxID=2748662 RepID=A0A8J7BZF5_9CYAN|nr:hypothetical protein [Iningainema tapete]MBD2777557.1 hypothetical protein [Iningainema tapete BLCC-T55]
MKTLTVPETLKNRDYTLIIDKSSSMSTPDQRNGRTRWEEVQESTLGLARKCEQLDSDGITVYVFAGRFRRYDNVTSGKVAQIFEENEPVGNTDLAGAKFDICDTITFEQMENQTLTEVLLGAIKD